MTSILTWAKNYRSDFWIGELKYHNGCSDRAALGSPARCERRRAFPARLSAALLPGHSPTGPAPVPVWPAQWLLRRLTYTGVTVPSELDRGNCPVWPAQGPLSCLTCTGAIAPSDLLRGLTGRCVWLVPSDLRNTWASIPSDLHRGQYHTWPAQGPPFRLTCTRATVQSNLHRGHCPV